MEAKEKIIFPLDVASIDEAVHYCRILRGHVGLFKVGLELFVTAGPAILDTVHEQGGAGIFLDLKFHDIPETVKRAALSASRHGARFVTVHTDGGPCMLRAVVAGMQGTGTKVLAITALTSLGREDLLALGYTKEFESVEDFVLSRARMAYESGCDGVVCSGRETQAIKDEFGPDLVVINPGIRPSWDGAPPDDQKRVMTPAEAIKNGADYLVIGRPIRLAQEPADAADRIAAEIAQVCP